jgi:hypothetical protein
VTLLPSFGAPSTRTTIRQDNSLVLGNQIAGSVYNTNNNYLSTQHGATVIEQLLRKLHDEISKEAHCSDMLQRLQRYHGGIVRDGVKGLEAKLARAGREHELIDAMERKESFAKLLESWSLYASAQEIFVYLLAKAEHLFNTEILPDLDQLSDLELNKRINILIVDPTVSDCGASVFKIDHFVAMGMIYWLAEQCFVRWH